MENWEIVKAESEGRIIECVDKNFINTNSWRIKKPEHVFDFIQMEYRIKKEPDSKPEPNILNIQMFSGNDQLLGHMLNITDKPLIIKIIKI